MEIKLSEVEQKELIAEAAVWKMPPEIFVAWLIHAWIRREVMDIDGWNSR